MMLLRRPVEPPMRCLHTPSSRCAGTLPVRSRVQDDEPDGTLLPAYHAFEELLLYTAPKHLALLRAGIKPAAGLVKQSLGAGKSAAKVVKIERSIKEELTGVANRAEWTGLHG